MSFLGFIFIAVIASGYADPTFRPGTAVSTILSREINEASGLAASRIHKNILYTHNDGGDTTRLFAVDLTTGSLVATIGISGADHYDWEDIAMGPCPDNSSCIYIADAGHSSSRKVNMIYMVPEPVVVMDQTVTVASKLPFRWSGDDGQSLMVDNNRDVYLISNVVGGKGLIVKLPSSAWDAAEPVNVTSNAHVNITTVHHDPGAADISPDGTEVLVKAREHVFYWKVANNDYLTALTTPPVELPYHQETFGEAICWDATGTNYYTLSEGRHQPIYEYIREIKGPVVG